MSLLCRYLHQIYGAVALAQGFCRLLFISRFTPKSRTSHWATDITRVPRERILINFRRLGLFFIYSLLFQLILYVGNVRLLDPVMTLQKLEEQLP
jgi:hypothetical protein